MAIYLTSDHHFAHKNILDFEPRPVIDVEQMGEHMVDTWNRTVRKTDTIYHLGDFCFGGVTEWQHYLDRLKGDIVLIKGNHDKSRITLRMLREGLLHEYHPLGTTIKVDGQIINLSHYPMLIGSRPRNFSVHGHLHSFESGFSNHINVGVDSTLAREVHGDALFGAPIPIEAVLERMHTLNPIIESERAAKVPTGIIQ